MGFREMRRCRQALTRAECAAILREEKRGTLAVIAVGHMTGKLVHEK